MVKSKLGEETFNDEWIMENGDAGDDNEG